MFLFFSSVHPVIKIAAGMVVLICGVVFHRTLLDVAGGVAIVLAAIQWMRGGTPLFRGGPRR